MRKLIRDGVRWDLALLLIDPGCEGINDLMAGLDYACPAAVKLGGIACPHSAPHHSLLFDQEVCGGAVGCLIDGAWGLDPVVAQGCRPIGPVFEVEQAQRNVVLEVSVGNQRQSPVAALQAILTDLSPQERELVKNSLFLGVGRSEFSLAGSEDPPVGEDKELRPADGAADAAAAYIYLTPVALEEVPGRAWAMQAPSWNDIRFKFPPRVIVMSKPDIYDPQSAVARYASENRFVPALELQAFTIFTREGEELPAVQP
jgi:hypothetical protein